MVPGSRQKMPRARRRKDQPPIHSTRSLATMAAGSTGRSGSTHGRRQGSSCCNNTKKQHHYIRGKHAQNTRHMSIFTAHKSGYNAPSGHRSGHNALRCHMSGYKALSGHMSGYKAPSGYRSAYTFAPHAIIENMTTLLITLFNV